MKKILLSLITLGLTCAAAPLVVVNGDFSDLAGLTQKADGWYAGLPKGWTGSEGSYAVHAKRGATAPTCNPSTLGFFRQQLGVLEQASDITLTFDVSEPWKPDVLLNATLLDGNLLELAGGDFKETDFVACRRREEPPVIAEFHRSDFLA